MAASTGTIVQQIVLLGTGAPASVQLRNDMLALYTAAGNWQAVAAIVDQYMNGQPPSARNGVSSLLQDIAANGLGLRLSDHEAEQLTQDLMDRGIDSWSELFALIIGERITLTDESGGFVLTRDLPHGQYFVTGGVDLATKRPFFGTLSAPPGAVVLTPLTTLVNLMLRRDQIAGIDQAEEWLFKAFNLPRVDLSLFDHRQRPLCRNPAAESHCRPVRSSGCTNHQCVVGRPGVTGALDAGLFPG